MNHETILKIKNTKREGALLLDGLGNLKKAWQKGIGLAFKFGETLGDATCK